MRIDAVKVRRLYLQVADQLSELIHSGALKPGERLPSERELAERFGVSRPTIREAMIALEISGIVEIRSGSGVYALSKPPGTGSPTALEDEGPGPFEILEARQIFEAEAAALAAERITDEEIAKLESALEALAAENIESTGMEGADGRFHCLIAEACQNSAVSSIVAWLWELRNQSPIGSLFHERVRAEGIHPIIEDHQAILDALRARDPEAARTAMRNHLSRVIKQVTAALESAD